MRVSVLKISLLIISMGLLSCGGGGGSSTTTPTTSSRCQFVSDRVALTPTNTPYFAGLALIGNKQPATVPVDPVGMAQQMAIEVSSVPTTDGYTSPNGAISVSSQVSTTTGLGSMTITYNQYNNAGVTVDGAITVQIAGVDSYSASTDKTMTFTSLNVGDSYGTVSLSGNIRAVNSISSYFNDPITELTMSFKGVGVGGHEIEFFDYWYKVENNSFDGATVIQNYRGKIFDSTHGCTFVQNTNVSYPLTVGGVGANQINYYGATPTSGSISFAGVGNDAQGKITFMNGSALIEVDTAGNGTYDYSQSTTWDAL